MREEVVGLEDDADTPPDSIGVDTTRGDLLALEEHPAGPDGLEDVYAAQECRLARPGRSDQAHDLMLGHREVDPSEYFKVTE